MSRVSRLNVLLKELGSLGRWLSRRVPCGKSEEAEKHKHHQVGMGVPRWMDSQMPGSPPGLHEAFRNVDRQNEKRTRSFVLHKETEAQRVNTCGRLGQWEGWAQTQELGLRILNVCPAYLLCLLIHTYIFPGLAFKICSPSGISERAFMVCF